METLVHFAQAHETFRKPEVEAVAELARFTIQFVEYSLNAGYIPLNFRPSYDIPSDMWDSHHLLWLC